jgi:hypothetical protein
MAIQVYSNAAPQESVTIRYSKKWAEELAAASALQPGQWFVYERAPGNWKAQTDKWFAVMPHGKHLRAYRDIQQRVIIKRVGETEAASTAPEPNRIGPPRGLKPEEINPKAKPHQGKKLATRLL